MKIDHEKLRALVRRLLGEAGSAESEAEIVADHLVEANLAGHDSHGVGMLPAYFRNLKAGTLRPNQAPEIVSETANFAVWDGRGGYGQVIAGAAMEWAIGAAKRHGVAVHALRNTHHIGRVGTYGEMAAKAGLVSVQFVNGNSGRPLVAPFRGREGRLSTNPICIAVPGTATTAPVILDFATSRIALGKVRVAHNEGKRVVEGALIDEAGRPTTDPGVIYGHGPGGAVGAVLPFGEHKGYGLALVAELLAGAICGAGTIQPKNPRDRGILNAALSVVLDPERLAARAFIEAEIDALIAWAKSAPAIDPALPVLVPGEPERIARAERMARGITIDETTWREIVAAAATIGIAVEAA
ncbi:MAG TPA: malate/lactate/ureidoglycolate dehydrogenase [Stellaceae bacterium]|nr:malate/lactate/ureidoglycolate dehydrogenase [Stellaceae bacterium]